MTTTSAGPKLGLRKLTARIGAVVTGVGPELELDAPTVTAIRAALSEHKAPVFRGISIDDAGQQRFARYFGELTTAHPTIPAADGAPNVLPVDSEDGRVNYWHTDVTFVLNPPQASTLRSIIIPPPASRRRPPRPSEGEIAGERDHRQGVDDQRRDQAGVAERGPGQR